MIPAVLRRRRYSLLWLLVILILAVTLGVLAAIPLLRGEPDGRIGSLVGQPAPSLSARASMAELVARRCRQAPRVGELLGDELRAVPDGDAGDAAARRGVRRRPADPGRRLG